MASSQYFTDVSTLPNWQRNFNSISKRKFTDKSHEFYDSYKFLLAYKFKNSVGHVKTAYLDKVFENLYKPKSGSSEDVHDYYFVFIKILKQYINSIGLRYTNSTGDILNFYSDILAFWFKNNNFSISSSIRRIEVSDIYYYIFNKFNEFLDSQKIPHIKPIKKMYKSDFIHNEVIEEAKRKKWVKNNQQSLKEMLIYSHSEHKPNSRSKKLKVYHPDLYGFPY